MTLPQDKIYKWAPLPISGLNEAQHHTIEKHLVSYKKMIKSINRKHYMYDGYGFFREIK